MSRKADIDDMFDEFMNSHPEISGDALRLKFGIYEALDWDAAAAELAEWMDDYGFKIDDNMRATIISHTKPQS